jgi:DNA helicase-2/ATP-dependent DNA helicase PcrA
MRDFATNYQNLNDNQREAVDTTDGPLVVIAGPGTGKTQLLSMRVAAILKQPNNTPDQVLCLTFTDNAARNMQDRLVGIVGRPAYHVAIHTFHSFADRIINNYPDYFIERPLLHPIDELGQFQLLRRIFDKLDYGNPLGTKLGDEYLFLKDTRRTIGWLKQAGISADEFSVILEKNEAFFAHTAEVIADTFAVTPSAKQLDAYANVVVALSKAPASSPNGGLLAYAELSARELTAAIEATDTTGRYAPAITAWRRRWLEKDQSGKQVFKDWRQLPKLRAVQAVYTELRRVMALEGLYDFDDMLLEVVMALEKSPELALAISERYQYVLVDEFQDTNQAQLRILWALGDASPHEMQPNLMVVGDPNQAIYAFQGAFNTSFQQFQNRYKDVRVVNLTDNYRSAQTILEASYEVIKQNPDDYGLLSHEQLVLAAHAVHEQDIVEHDVLASELAHYQWVADKIKEYLDAGHAPEEIAVIAPRHRYLERIVPYLAENAVPIAYERREDVLDAPLVQQMLTIAELIQAIADNRYQDSDVLLSEVLNYDFWNIPALDLVNFSVQCYEQHSHWLPALLESPNNALRRIAEWLHALSQHAALEPLEYMLDEIGGGRPTSSMEVTDDKPFTSPFNSFYFSSDAREADTEKYLTHLGQLTVLRQRLRSWQPDKNLHLKDLLDFVNLHRQASVNILSTNPHIQAVRAVQLMTAYKAKGLEFEIVFVINSQDEVWGIGAREYVDRIRLPKNVPIKPAGDSEADKLRLFFVALTRAKHTLHIVSYNHNIDDKLSVGLSFIGGNNKDSQPVHKSLQPQFIERQVGSEAVRLLSTSWAYRFRQIIADKPTLFGPILDNYRLSATHLNNFLNIIDAGPEYFLQHNLLRFPESMSPSAAYGDAVHQTLKMVTSHSKGQGALPSQKNITDYFADILVRKHLRNDDYLRFLGRGKQALKTYMNSRGSLLTSDIIPERNFIKEGVLVGEAKLSGKIDAIHQLEGNQLELIDYKTGKPSRNWQGADEFERRKLHRYHQQLYFYKLLVDGSSSFGKRYTTLRGGLEFIETESGSDTLIETLWVTFEQTELDRLIKLVQAVWYCICNLLLPDTSTYSHDLSGIIDFENYLIETYANK